MTTKVQSHFHAGSVQLDDLPGPATANERKSTERNPGPFLSSEDGPMSSQVDLPAADTSKEAYLFLLGSVLLEFLVWG